MPPPPPFPEYFLGVRMPAASTFSKGNPGVRGGKRKEAFSRSKKSLTSWMVRPPAAKEEAELCCITPLPSLPPRVIPYHSTSIFSGRGIFRQRKKWEKKMRFGGMGAAALDVITGGDEEVMKY